MLPRGRLPSNASMLYNNQQLMFAVIPEHVLRKRYHCTYPASKLDVSVCVVFCLSKLESVLSVWGLMGRLVFLFQDQEKFYTHFVLHFTLFQNNAKCTAATN